MASSKEKYILAIDHGTSGAKTAIISTSGAVIDWIFEEVNLFLPEPGAAEQDPEEWWNAILNTAKKLIEKGTVPVEDIVGICNTSQWSGTVALDEDGKPLMRAIIWMDTRGAKYVKELHKGLIQVSGFSLFKVLKSLRISGGAPTLSGKDPIAHILWIKKERPEIYEKTFKFLEPQDYINFKFTGKYAASFASIHLHWITDIRDIKNIKYSKKLLKMVKIDRNKLPTDLKWSTDILGPIKPEIADKLGLKSNTQVVMGAPDLHAATIGSGAVKDFEGHFCIGTSDWLLCHYPKKKTDIIHNMGAFPGAIKEKYMLANEQEIAGGALSFLRDKILYHQDELLFELFEDELNKAFDDLVKKVSEMEKLSSEEASTVKQRLLNYKGELLENEYLKDIHRIFDQIAKDLSKESKIQGETLDFLKKEFITYKNRILREVPLKNVYKIFDQIVEKTPAGSNNLIFTPWLFGERAPVDDHTIRGGIYNLSLDTTRGHLIRAIFEGVAYNVRWLLFYVEKFIKKELIKQKPELKNADKIMPELTIIGGGANSKIWCQIFADVLNRRIKQLKDPIQANARGAAIIASVGLGYLKWEDVGKNTEYANIYEPNPANREIYDKLYQEFLNIYKITKKLYRRLNS